MEKLGLTIASPNGQAYSPDIAPGLVVQTTPKSGSAVVRDGSVTLLLSQGPKPLPVPKFAGMTEADAKTQIKSSHFTYDSKDSTKQFDAKVPKDTVIAAFGVNNLDLSTVSMYGDQQPVRLVVSAGALPDVTGMTVDAATAALAQLDVTAKPGAQNYSDTVPNGNVIGIDQPKGSVVQPGGTVNLIISQGPEPVPVPDIGGQNWTQAKAALTAAGLNFKFNNQKSQQIANTLPNSCTVISVSPGGGTTVPKGTTVTVTLAVQNGP